MPKRFEVQEGGTIEIGNGITVVVALARGKKAVLGVAVADELGFIEEPAVVKRWAARIAAEIDKAREIGDY